MGFLIFKKMKNVKIKFIDKDNDNTIEVINAIEFIAFRAETEDKKEILVNLNIETAMLLKDILNEMI